MSSKTRCAALLLLVSLFGLAARAQAPEPPKPSGLPPLSEAQRKAIDAILAETKAQIAPLTLTLGKGVKEMRETLLTRTADEATRQRLVDRISSVAAQLVAIRIRATARILGVLTAEQKDAIASEEREGNWNTDIYEVLVRAYGLPKMG
jgi:LTXXQ motif family protein